MAFTASGIIISQLFQSSFGRAVASMDGLTAWVSRFDKKIVKGMSTAEAERDILREMNFSPESESIYGDLSSAEIVDFIFNNSLGRDASEPGRTTWIARAEIKPLEQIQQEILAAARTNSDFDYMKELVREAEEDLGGSAPDPIPDASPAAPSTPDLDAASDYNLGLSNSDDITSTRVVTLTGTGTIGTTVTITSDIDGEVGTGVVDSSGHYSILTSALTEGVHALTASVTDTAGNKGASTPLKVTIDLTPPVISTPDLKASSDTGDSDSDDITADNQPIFTGTTEEPYAYVYLYTNVYDYLGKTRSDGSGKWSFDMSTTSKTLADGLNRIFAQVSDVAGNAGVSGRLDVTVHAPSHAAPSKPDLLAASDWGMSDSDDITKKQAVTLTGTGTIGTTVTITSDVDGEVGTGIVDGSGNYIIVTSALTEGDHALTASATDVAGKESAASTPLNVTIDLTPPVASTPVLDTSSDTGNSNSDNITANNQPIFNGTSEAYATIYLYSDADGLLGTTTADGSGKWSFDMSTTPATLSDNDHKITAKVLDRANNLAESDALEVTVVTSLAAPSTPDLDAASDRGVSDSDDITSTQSIPFITLTGTGTIGETVTITSDIDGEVGTGVVDGSGHYSIVTSALTEGYHALTASVTDRAGNEIASRPFNVTVDRNAPVASSTPDLDASSDTGNSDSDNITVNNQPIFNGTSEAYAEIDLYSDADGYLGTTRSDGSGKWSFDMSTTSKTLSDNDHKITAVVTDFAGNAGPASDALDVTVVTSLAAPSTPDLDAASDSGVSDSDDITKIQAVTLTGTGTIGETVTITSDVDGEVGTGVVDGSGNYIIVTSALTEGDHALTASATDVAGKESAASTPLNVTIDLTPPVASTPVLDTSSDTGNSNSDNITANNQPIFNGTSEAYATIYLYSDADGLLGTTTADGSGNWSLDLSVTHTTLSDDVHNITVIVSDAAGNESPRSDVLAVTVHAPSPEAPSTPDLDAASDSGVSDSDDITNIQSVTLNGTGTIGEIVTITSDVDGEVGTGVVDGSGHYSIVTSALTEGYHVLTASVTDTAGKESASRPLKVTVDLTALVASSTLDLDTSSDSGSTDSDNITANSQPIFTGTSEAYATIELFSNVDGSLGTTTADAAGHWSLDLSMGVIPTTLSNDVHHITAVVIDAAGNAGPISDGLYVTVDQTAPVASSTPDLDASSDMGDSDSDDITADNQPIFTGTTEEPYAAVYLFSDADGYLGKTRSDGSGKWSFDISTSPEAEVTTLSDGLHNITTILSDVAGNASNKSGGLDVNIVTASPTAPSTPDLIAASDWGVRDSDDITSIQVVTLTGTGTIGRTVTITSDVDGEVGTGVVDGSGHYSIVTSALTEGAHALTASLTDVAGNVGTSAALDITVDQTAPVASSTPDLDASSDTGDSDSDNITADNQPIFNGTSEAYAKIYLYSDADGYLGTTIANGSGNWSLDLSGNSTLSDGDHKITTRVTDVAGNESPRSDALDVTVVTSLAAPSAPDLDAASDSGVSDSDDITSTQVVTLTGTGTIGETVTITSDIDGEVGTGVVDSSGHYSIVTSALTEGDHALTASVEDTRGNVGTSAALDITVDITSPAFVSGAKGVLTYNEDIVLEDSGLVTLKESLTSQVLTASASASGTDLNVTPALAFTDLNDEGDDYYVAVDANAVSDVAGNLDTVGIPERDYSFDMGGA